MILRYRCVCEAIMRLLSSIATVMISAWGSSQPQQGIGACAAGALSLDSGPQRARRRGPLRPRFAEHVSLGSNSEV